MFLIEREIDIAKEQPKESLINFFDQSVSTKLKDNETPVRFAITKTDDVKYHCEIGVLAKTHKGLSSPVESIFKFRKRKFEKTDHFNAVLLVPTGIGAEIGGHAGDAGPVARLISSACDNLITHPNVVNASDINELPENGLYVEGSVISRLLMGAIGLQKVRSNRVVLVVDKHDNNMFHEAAVNAMSAARSTLGLESAGVIIMDDKVLMQSLYATSGRAVGKIDHFERIYQAIGERLSEFDAIALSSVIKVPQNFHYDYYTEDMVNPWGGVEAMLTHAISQLFDIPSAHSPMLESKEILDIDLGIVDPRKAAEIISMTFLHSVLKGLHKSPKIISDTSVIENDGIISASDISCVIIPEGCIGLPTLAAIEQEIPVIAVRENKNRMQNRLEDFPFLSGKLYFVDSYLEAVGMMHALRYGIAQESVRRPIEPTVVKRYHEKNALTKVQEPIVKSERAIQSFSKKNQVG